MDGAYVHVPLAQSAQHSVCARTRWHDTWFKASFEETRLFDGSCQCTVPEDQTIVRLPQASPNLLGDGQHFEVWCDCKIKGFGLGLGGAWREGGVRNCERVQASRQVVAIRVDAIQRTCSDRLGSSGERRPRARGAVCKLSARVSRLRVAIFAGGYELYWKTV